ncbi:hypothetical protein L1987_72906 [Smallanthus sonchifolius]|uniref:Uncharacterized protein n=1 Tax=Smallanthus sonchifolius TaxID=185202 RepID=A0ACB9AXC8_9ASTR|nr:hypothetical protein L1987_72906 [Smallanthus sonchifolius]
MENQAGFGIEARLVYAVFSYTVVHQPPLELSEDFHVSSAPLCLQSKSSPLNGIGHNLWSTKQREVNSCSLYELWCLARAAGIRHCVLFCDVEETHCRDWNNKRREKDGISYNDGIFEDLVRRFERPDRRNRWDSPLFELWPFKEGVDKSSPAIMDLVSYITKKVDSKTRDVKILQPTIATQSARFSEANSLYEMDRATQEVTSAIVEAQSLAMGGPVTGLSISHNLPTINISRSVGLPELRRLRKTFIKLTGQSSLSGLPPPVDADSAKRMFIDYLNQEPGSG